MLRPLRIRHRRIFTVLGVLLPLAFATGIGLRKAVPLWTNSHWAAKLRDAETLAWERKDLFANVPVRVRLLRGPAWYRVSFVADRGFAKPDLLVYWMTGSPAISETLPSNAQLLGAFDESNSLQLPDAASDVGGVLVLYSLADSEIVDVSRPVRFSDTAP